MNTVALAPRNHNRPTPAELAADVMERIGSFLQNNPVIETTEQAGAAAKLAALSKKHLDDLEDERKERGRPHREQLQAIQSEYAEPLRSATAVLGMLKERLTVFAKAEEARRRAEADRLAREAYEAEERLRRAAEALADASDDAAHGEVGVDLVAATAAEGVALRDAAKAARVAARAERDTGVRMATGVGRAASLRSREILSITDPVAAVTELGLTPDIEEAVRKSAAAFKKLRGRLPNGVTSHIERSI